MRAVTLLVLLVIALTGCSSALRWQEGAPASGFYTVRQGDSLYAIALRFDLSVEALARWNALGDSDLIFAGQRLRVRAPPKDTKTVVAPAVATESRPQTRASVDWLWPAGGEVASYFGDNAGSGKGIEIAGKEGDDIFAAAGGKVVYSGDGLIGYGNLIIVKHNRSVLSAYGYNRELLVGEGDIVTAGQRIARMGLGPGRRPLLHFEIRIDGQPADPLGFLPAQK